jgi:hypothetical protein
MLLIPNAINAAAILSTHCPSAPIGSQVSKSNPAGTDGEVATFAVIGAIVDSLAEPCASHIEVP